MEELLFDSINCAAGYINGDLKKTVFRRFLKLVNSDIQNQDDTSAFPCSAVFVATAYGESTEEERKILNKHITDELSVIPELIGALKSFWQEDATYDEAYTTGMCSLLHLLTNSCQPFKKCLQADDMLTSIVVSLKEHFNKSEVHSLEEESLHHKILCCCLEMICLCVDDHVSRVKFIQSGLVELTEKLANAPDAIVRLISKAIIGHLSVECPNRFNDITSPLTDEEVATLLAMLKTGSRASLCISEYTVASMLKSFMSNKANVGQFEQHKLACLLERKWDSSSIDAIITKLNSSSLDVVESTHKVSHDAENSTHLTNGLPDLVSILMEYFVKHILQLDSPIKQQLTVHKFDNVAVSLQLTEALLSWCSDQIQKQIQDVIVSTPGVARASSVLIEHLHDDGTSESFQLHALKSLLLIMMQLTDHSPQLCRELGLSGFVAVLKGFLGCLADQLLLNTEGDLALVSMILTILLNCANEPVNLPMFEAAGVPEIIIEFAHHPMLDVAIISKMILSFLVPILTNEQYAILKLTNDEAEHLVSAFSKAVASPDLRTDEHSAVELLTFFLNFTKQAGTSLLQGNNGKQERKDSNFLSNFKQRIKVSASNIQMLVNFGIMKSLESLTIKGTMVDSVITEKSLHLLWNILHDEATMKLISPSVLAILASIHFEVNTCIESLILCIKWLTGNTNKSDTLVAFRYAQTCYTYGSYEECANVCSNIKKQISTHKSLEFDPSDLELLHGKALYHCYQPELRYLIKNEDESTQEELALVSDECFKKTKNAITLLGKCLDIQHIDEEGSRFLDFALNFCATDLNSLYQCKRCLLCHRGGQKLKKSHLWPNSVLKRIYKSEYEGETKPFLFGHQRARPKGVKECTFFMFCYTCEELLSQNGEEQFAKLLDSIQKDPHSTQLTYGNWLYSFAVGMVFRELATEFIPYFPNCQEIYNAYMLCRKHLFTLEAKIEGEVIQSFSKSCAYQYEKICSAATGDLLIYMIRCDTKLASSDDPIIRCFSEYSHCAGSVATCRLKDAKLDLSGCIHFLEIYCNGIHFLLKFQASENCAISDKFLINICGNEDQYSLPSEDLSAIPEGVWSVIRHLGTMAFDSHMDTYQIMSDKTLQMVSSPTSSHHDEQPAPKGSTLEVLHYTADMVADSEPFLNLPCLHCFSFLPKDYVVRKDIQLPKGHMVVTHFTAQGDDLLITYFLCMNGKSSYVIIVHYDGGTDQQIIDGVYISNDAEPKVSGFLLENRSGMENLPRPFTLDELQMMIDEQLPSWLQFKGIVSLPQLVHLMECRSALDTTRSVPSLDLRCQPHGCWYCKNLCHCCMWPISQQEGKLVQLQPDKRLYFCGDECRQLMYPDPGSPPAISATYHKMKSDKMMGPAKLQILKSVLSEGEKQSRLEFIELCIDTPPGAVENVAIGKPYVLWHIRSTNQQFLDFVVNDNCEPLECIWSAEDMSLKDEAVRNHLSNLLKNVLQIVFNQIGFPDLKSFVQSYRTSFSSDQGCCS